MGRLEGKVAIVTGAARGTGAATARRFVAEGARVVLADVRDELGSAVAKELGDAAHYAHLDVTEETDWRRGVEAACERFGGVDVLVNNAAILHLESIEDTTVEDFRRVVDVNQLGTFLGIRAVVAPMRAGGGGSIVNVSSIDGLEGMNGTVAYASSKWGVRGISRVAAIELGRFDIRVNTVCPGGGSFEMIEPFVRRQIERLKQAAERGEPQPSAEQFSHSHLGRHVAIDDIASTILFLASDESRSCTGADFPVDCGYTAGKSFPGAPGV